MSRAVPLLTERVSATQAMQNAASLAFTRTSVSVLAGSIAGVLGLTGLSGFLFYFLSVLLSAAVWLYRIDFNVKASTARSLHQLQHGHLPLRRAELTSSSPCCCCAAVSSATSHPGTAW